MRFLHKFNSAYDYDNRRNTTPSYAGEPYVALIRYTYSLVRLYSSSNYDAVEYIGQADLWNDDYTTNLGSVYLWYDIDEAMLFATETNSLMVGTHWCSASFDDESGKYFTYSSDPFNGDTIQSSSGNGEYAYVIYEKLMPYQ